MHGVLTPWIYLHGFTAYATCAICLGLAAPGVFLGYWDIRRSLSRNDTIILGSPDFSVFQRNPRSIPVSHQCLYRSAFSVRMRSGAWLPAPGEST